MKRLRLKNKINNLFTNVFSAGNDTGSVVDNNVINTVSNTATKLTMADQTKSIQKCLAIMGGSAFAMAMISTITMTALGGGILGSNSTNNKAKADSISDTLAPIDAAKISLSITNSTGSSSSSSPDITIQSPSGGGIATGYHTLNISSNSGAGYTVNLTSNTTSNTMTSTTGSDTINATSGTASDPTTLSDGTWGYALPGQKGYNKLEEYAAGTSNAKNGEEAQSVLNSTKYTAVPTSSSNAIITSDTPSLGNNQVVYYGANIPKSSLAGTYTTNVKYTASVKLPGAITIDSITPNSYTLNSSEDTKVTVSGANLETAYQAWIDFDGDGAYDKDSEACTISYPITNTSSTDTLTCAIPVNKNIKAGSYKFYVLTQNGSAVSSTFTYVKSAVSSQKNNTCKNGDHNSNCIVDKDSNMIPVKYANGGWQKADVNTAGDWYDYANKKWANAVTVKSDKLDTYKNAAAGTEIDNDDVLGYWVYIPRYAYEVQRRDATDKVVSAQNFDIHFETILDTKKTPAAGCSTVSGSTLTAKDYRTGCGLDRTYYSSNDTKASSTTWATHPAFTLGNKELNGFWIAKFEMTGTHTAPTVKPNQHTNISESVGNFSTMIKSMGVANSANVGGSSVSGLTQNSHNLNNYFGMLLKNDQWGAVAYLSASEFGAGVNKVRNNGANSWKDKDADGQNGWWKNPNDTKDQYGGGGITGCGPHTTSDTAATADDGQYYDKGTELNATTTESSTACNSNTGYAYNGSIGQLASTTNNIYGVYDMAGGAWEYVAGAYTTGDSGSTSGMTTALTEPYVNLYKSSDGFDQGAVAWQDTSGEGNNNYRYNFQICKYGNCGGAALHETRAVQSVIAWNNGWGSDNSYFVVASDPWFLRGGRAYNGSAAGVFASGWTGGGGWIFSGARAALVSSAGL